ncbi:hypothetical protein [Mesorhizobium sp. A556]
MAIAITPKFEITIPDDPAAEAAGMLTPTRFNSGSDMIMATARLLGRLTADAGTVEELDAAAVKTLLGLVNAVLTSAAQTFTKPQRVSFTTLTYGSTVTPDLNDNNGFILTMTGNPTIANPSNIASAIGQEIMIVFRGAFQPSFGSYWKFAGGDAPTFDGSLNVVGGVVISATEISAFAGLGVA